MNQTKKDLPDYAYMSDEEMKEQRLYLMLKSMCDYNTRTSAWLAEEIGITEPTLRDFMKWKFSKKTFKMVESWFKSVVNYLNEVYVNYKRVETDDE